MKIKSVLIPLLVLFLVVSCTLNSNLTRQTFAPNQLNESQQILLDSILRRGLDYEALYTIIGKIKPMSTVASFRFPIANTDSLKRTKGEVLDLTEKARYLNRIEELQYLTNSLDYPDLKFVLLPFKSPSKETKYFDLNVIRVSLMDSLLKVKASFFGQLGLVPGTDPAIVVAAVENADRYERLRAYGYLFGYPEYAIDFFIEAALESDLTKKHVERNFFQIPAYAAKGGAFVYAYPKSHVPDQTDSTLYYRAKGLLDYYSELRNNYLSPDSTLQASKLLMDLYSTGKKGK